MKISPIEKVLENENFIFKYLKNDFRKSFGQIADYFLFIKQIKKYNIDTVYIFDDNLRPILFSYFSNVNKIYSFGFGLQNRFLTNTNILPKKLIKENKYLILHSFFKLLKIPVVEKKIALPSLSFQKKYLKIFINLDSSIKQKNWGDENFFKLIKKINAFCFPIFVINCLNYKSEIFRLLEQEKISYEDVSKVNISDLFIKINECDISISNDTGPAHMSIALEIKTFIIFLEKNKFSYKYSKFMFPLILDKDKDEGNYIVNEIDLNTNILNK